MSTRMSIAHGERFHLFFDGLGREVVCLEMRDFPFEATAEYVTVAIPIEVWGAIRPHASIDLSPAEWTDQEILDRVARDLDQRIGGGDKRVPGSLIYGDASRPADEQRAAGIQFWQSRRSWAQRMRTEIAELETENRLAPGAELHSMGNIIATGPGFCCYEELFDRRWIYLRLESRAYEAGRGESGSRVMVEVPVPVWELIRRYPGPRESVGE